MALESRVPARTRHDAETVARHLRVLTVTTRIGAVISIFFGIQGLIVSQDVWVTVLKLASGAILVPYNTGVQPDWSFRLGFSLTVVSAWVMVVAVVWYALREIRRAREAMEAAYDRSERLLTNILPATIAQRLKDPSRNIIADKYDDASILFADIAGYTKRASDTTPTDLVRFLDRLYTDLDALVDRHGLEKVNTR